jgi:hypothetical protein
MNGILNIHESIFSRRFQMLNSTVFVEEPFYGTHVLGSRLDIQHFVLTLANYPVKP